jgi:hypothetical protein
VSLGVGVVGRVVGVQEEVGRGRQAFQEGVVVGRVVGVGGLGIRGSPGEGMVAVAGVRGQRRVEGRVVGARVVVVAGVGAVQGEGLGPG